MQIKSGPGLDVLGDTDWHLLHTLEEIMTEREAFKLSGPCIPSLITNILLCSKSLSDITGSCLKEFIHTKILAHALFFLSFKPHLAKGWFDWENRFSCGLPTIGQPCVSSPRCVIAHEVRRLCTHRRASLFQIHPEVSQNKVTVLWRYPDFTSGFDKSKFCWFPQ